MANNAINANNISNSPEPLIWTIKNSLAKETFQNVGRNQTDSSLSVNRDRTQSEHDTSSFDCEHGKMLCAQTKRMFIQFYWRHPCERNRSRVRIWNFQ